MVIDLAMFSQHNGVAGRTEMVVVPGRLAPVDMSTEATSSGRPAFSVHRTQEGEPCGVSQPNLYVTHELCLIPLK